MNVGQLFGFDEVLAAIVASYPEVKLHVSRADNEVFATAASGDLLAISTGKAGDAPGLVVRSALTDLRARLVARDAGVAEAAASLATSEEDAVLAAKGVRLNEVLGLIEKVEDDMEVLQEALAVCDIEEFDVNSNKLRTVRRSLAELNEEADRLFDEGVTPSDSFDDDDNDFGR